MLALGVLMPADAKKVKEQPLLFPDGTEVSAWFKDSTVPAPEDLGRIYKISDYGAISDPNLIQTELIQSVIDKAAADGGGVIVIPEGIYKSGALFFRQGTHLHLSRGAVLLGSESIYDFPIIDTRIEGEICKYFSALINVDGLDGLFDELRGAYRVADVRRAAADAGVPAQFVDAPAGVAQRRDGAAGRGEPDGRVRGVCGLAVGARDGGA